MDTHSCSQCGATLEYLGVLGRRVYGRCRQCGTIEGLPVCHECIGNGEIYDETTGEWDVCEPCNGSGLRLPLPIVRGPVTPT